MGAIQQLRQAFTNSLGGQGAVSDFHMDMARHDGVESQILSASGMWSDGTPFSIQSDKLRAGADLTAASRELAQRLLDNKAPPQ